MFDFTSRYAKLETAVYTAPDGREIPYVLRRFLPPGASMPLLGVVTFQPADRLDLLTHQLLGDPLQFWRIADANDAVNPFDLETPGRALRVPIPQP